MKKSLAILLSLLMMLSVSGFWAAAEEGTGTTDPLLTGYTHIPASTDKLEPGDRWFCAEEYAGLESSNGYIREDYGLFHFFISEDGNTLQVTNRYSDPAKGDTWYYTREESPEVFDCIKVLSAFSDPLPDSPDGLEEGSYWFDRAEMLSDLTAMTNAFLMDAETPEESAATQARVAAQFEAARNAEFRVTSDGAVLRMNTVYTVVQDGESITKTESWDEREHLQLWTWFYLNQVGKDKFEGYTRLPMEDSDDLADGAYWFDRAGLLADLNMENDPILATLKVYINDEKKNIIAVYPYSGFVCDDSDPEDYEILIQYLHQHVGTDAPAEEPSDDGNDTAQGNSFWDRIIAFFRSIIDFFKRMFGGI